MQHDQSELDNVSENVLRDMRSFTDRDRLNKLIQRAARHYHEQMSDRWGHEIRASIEANCTECGNVKPYPDCGACCGHGFNKDT